MWSPAFREGKWGVTEAGRTRREASWKTVRLAVSMRRGSNACWGFVSICADVIPILLVIKDQYHLLRTLTVSFRRHQIETEAVFCRREGGGRRTQWGELTGNSWKLLMLCCPISVGKWVWECMGYRRPQRKCNSHNITENMAKSLLGKGGLKGRLCCDQMTSQDGHPHSYLTGEEMPWTYRTRNSEFRILNVHLHPELVMCHRGWWQSGWDPAALWEGTLWNIWKGFEENEAVASRESWQTVWYPEGISPTERRALVTKLLWLEKSSVWEM